MRPLWRITSFGLRDLLRNRWTIVYMIFFLLATDGLLRMMADPSRALFGLIQVVLFLIPLFSILFGTLHFYDSREFMKLLLAQPIGRAAAYLGAYLSLAVSLSLGFAVGVSVPLLIHGSSVGQIWSMYGVLLASGWSLTFVFIGLAFLVSVWINDKGKGVAVALFVWLAAAVLYDGAVLMAAHMLSSYPLEKPLIGLTLLNPVDLARILLLIRMDISALMGYTGAVFERFFGDSLGISVAVSSLVLWSLLPVALGLHRFRSRDF